MILTQDTTVRSQLTVTIPNGGAFTGDIYAASPESRARGARIMDVALSGSVWTPSDLVFDVSLDGSQWLPARDNNGNLIRISGIDTGNPGSYSVPASIVTKGIYPHIRLRSVTAGGTTNVNQGGTRSVVVCIGG